jgi:Holliday junction resolvase
MSSHYGYGRRKELQLAEFLERRRFEWGRAVGSRGPLDLIANRGTLRLVIQVKATRRDSTSYSRLSQRDETRLLRSAAARKARPALALVCRNYVWLLSVPDQQLIDEGELRSLRYEYPDET